MEAVPESCQPGQKLRRDPLDATDVGPEELACEEDPQPRPLGTGDPFPVGAWASIPASRR